MKVFNLEKYVGSEGLTDKQVSEALASGWPQKCEGKEVVDRHIGFYFIADNWTIEVPEADK